MNYKKLKKPQNLHDQVWGQHLDWLSVVSSQVEENYARHLARVKEDARRSASLLPLRKQLAEAPQCKRSLFCYSQK